MKLNTLKAVLAFAAMALVAGNAKALTSYTGGDLIIGFTDTSNSSVSYLIDVGAVSQYTATTTFTLTNTGSGTTGADLSSSANGTMKLGSGWASDSTLVWSGFATTAGNTLFATDPNTPTGDTGSPGQGSPSTQITTMGNNFGGNATTANNLKGTYQNNGSGNSFYSFTAANEGSGLDYAYFNDTAEGSIGGGGAASDLYLEQMVQSTSGTPAAVTPGYFSINGSTGAITWNGSSAAVPEPSAYALCFCSVLLFWVLKRRQSVE